MWYIRYFVLIGNFKGSAHCLNEISISQKLIKKFFQRVQEIWSEQKRLKPMTLHCGIDHESL